MVIESKHWILKNYAKEGTPTSDHLQIKEVQINTNLDTIPQNHIVLKVLFLSVDPFLRTLLIGVQDGLYLEQLNPGQLIKTAGIAEVVQTKNDSYEIGDLVFLQFCPVADFCVLEPDPFLRKMDPASGISPLDHLSALGVPGFAAWVGIVILGNPKAGESVFISAAAGGVGIFAGQLAKLRGCYVVGSTGSDEKVNFLKEKLGFDEAFNYKAETDFDAALSKYFPNGIDVYLDNVGGKMLEAVLNHVNKRARIPLCGMISQYNEIWTEREGIRNLLNMVGKEVRMEGFMIFSYLNRFGEFQDEIIGYLREGKMVSEHKIYVGIESFLDSLTSMFTSSLNMGKVIIQVNKQIED